MGVTAKEAATVVLMRDRNNGSSGPEVLLMRRHAKANFGAGLFVFPGGMLEPEDYSPHALELCDGLTIEQAAAEIPDSEPVEKALGFRVAALRETFEEAGVLLARRADGTEFHPTDQEAPRLLKARADEHYLELVEELGLRLPVGDLVHIGHWITPVCRPIRFSAHFYLVSVAGAVVAKPDRTEVFDDKWVTPSEALELHERGELPLMSPTIINLRWLADYASTQDALTALRGKKITTIQPKIVVREDGKEQLYHPWDQEYATL